MSQSPEVRYGSVGAGVGKGAMKRWVGRATGAGSAVQQRRPPGPHVTYLGFAVHLAPTSPTWDSPSIRPSQTPRLASPSTRPPLYQQPAQQGTLTSAAPSVTASPPALTMLGSSFFSLLAAETSSRPACCSPACQHRCHAGHRGHCEACGGGRRPGPARRWNPPQKKTAVLLQGRGGGSAPGPIVPARSTADRDRPAAGHSLRRLQKTTIL